VLAVPDVPGLTRPELVPDPDARRNVLVLHGEVQGMLPATVMTDRAALEIPREELNAPTWDYIALGHYHVLREVAPNAFYSGSIDYTSANPWGELTEERVAGIPGKGFIERDLDTGEQVFHHVPVARPLIDLPPINARGLTPAELDERIRGAVEAAGDGRDGGGGGIDNKIVRLIVRDVSRTVLRELDHRAIRDYKRRALNFNLDFRPPDRRPGTSGAPGGRRLLDLKDVVREKLTTRPLDADIDRTAFVERAIAYIEEAQLVDVAPAALVDT
jgi:DNA repair exonuclease SbcCD nuclease subunit